LRGVAAGDVHGDHLAEPDHDVLKVHRVEAELAAKCVFVQEMLAG